MTRLSRTLTITLLTLVALAPMASARKKKVIIYYQSYDSPTWYTVSEVKTGPPVYTYTVPVTNAPVYVYSVAAPAATMGNVKIVAPAKDSTVFVDGEFVGTSGHVMQVALESGSHSVELRDPEGKTLFTGNVDVVAGQTTQIKPDTGAGDQ